MTPPTVRNLKLFIMQYNRRRMEYFAVLCYLYQIHAPSEFGQIYPLNAFFFCYRQMYDLFAQHIV